MEIPTTEPLAIELRGVSRHYAAAGSGVRAVNDVSLRVHRTERLAILGKSGCGKSTLLNLIGGLDRPTSGTIEVSGKVLSAMTPNGIADYRRDDVGMIFQSFNLIASRSALQNVELPMIFSGCSVSNRQKTAREMLAAVGLEQRLHHRPAELSGGEQQRVATARALVNQPDILLADEPTGNLDSKTAGEIAELLQTTVAERNMTMILVTHDEQLAQRLADRVVRMVDGRIVSASIRGRDALG